MGGVPYGRIWQNVLKRGRQVDSERDQRLVEQVLQGAKEGRSAFRTASGQPGYHPQGIYRILRRVGKFDEYRQLLKAAKQK